VLAGPFFDATTSVGSDDPAAFPSAFAAVTTTRNVCKTSPETGV
jgi:hypothetical protein